MVFLFLSVLFLVLRYYSFLFPGVVILSLSVLFYHKKAGSYQNNEPIFPLSILTLILLAISGLDGSTPVDLLDLICIHCSGILFLRGAEETKFDIKTGFLEEIVQKKERILFLFLWIAGFRMWWQSDIYFWEKLNFLSMIKSGILVCILGFLYLRSRKTKLVTSCCMLLSLSILLLQPTLLNFSYFYLFSFLQTDIESKKINAGINV
ncbi:hypothetical protein [Leptospira kirschneri]|uniref:Uncharacterized protein n=1 Tax=Leptospira kirschneri str. 200802841 TaxID=1193047 RepID=A0A828Y1A9_9LEPT|nr:hypothetical protein [Leptospira kirschneri]EKO51515.1 hypothetical protein LEP1GSC131_0364 [Leptospira kirschneri str. 200802841]EKQ83410.1 hypothetical protein LEP1GSC064_2352 [Leptospira kirschneri serovar Grippotyphosa str. Moskva]EKR07464.1 hypothetical protein LEP1GSC122_2978 [Leptospira kirschneri serovar Valbuzzi str. 200702274]EMK19267.1 hypothetical protein LEP1GSC042_0274 [Leptospira kirschneri serovar Bim str. PUO 1247]EMN04337.1 hypothetical protein LEP1GSC046_3633 [Leptospira 